MNRVERAVSDMFGLIAAGQYGEAWPILAKGPDNRLYLEIAKAYGLASWRKAYDAMLDTSSPVYRSGPNPATPPHANADRSMSNRSGHSDLVRAWRLGIRFSSSSHGFRCSSTTKSAPSNSKHLWAASASPLRSPRAALTAPLIARRRPARKMSARVPPTDRNHY